MLVLAMQFSRDGARPEASGSATDHHGATGAELDGYTGDHTHFPEGRQDAPTGKAGARGTHPHNRAVKPDRTGRSVVPGR
jgi:hypothetical protein